MTIGLASRQFEPEQRTPAEERAIRKRSLCRTRERAAHQSGRRPSRQEPDGGRGVVIKVQLRVASNKEGMMRKLLPLSALAALLVFAAFDDASARGGGGGFRGGGGGGGSFR